MSGVTTTYALSGSTVLSQTTGNETLFFYYDVNGNLAQIGYKNGTAAEIIYFVTHNLQGDVTAIYKASDSTLVGTYSYDPWGRLLAVTPASSASDPNGILTKNPFRYRGYYYDAETGFYYLNSRYYDPVTCRFINADTTFDENAGLFAYNLYAYCANNPVQFKDSGGNSIILACIIVCQWGRFCLTTFSFRCQLKENGGTQNAKTDPASVTRVISIGNTKAAGLSVRQLERLTGINRGVIQKA